MPKKLHRKCFSRFKLNLESNQKIYYKYFLIIVGILFIFMVSHVMIKYINYMF